MILIFASLEETRDVGGLAVVKRFERFERAVAFEYNDRDQYGRDEGRVSQLRDNRAELFELQRKLAGRRFVAVADDVEVLRPQTEPFVPACAVDAVRTSNHARH
jgi:hypothetical protein